jgi:hypothetical protein
LRGRTADHHHSAVRQTIRQRGRAGQAQADGADRDRHGRGECYIEQHLVLLAIGDAQHLDRPGDVQQQGARRQHHQNRDVPPGTGHAASARSTEAIRANRPDSTHAITPPPRLAAARHARRSLPGMASRMHTAKH